MDNSVDRDTSRSPEASESSWTRIADAAFSAMKVAFAGGDPEPLLELVGDDLRMRVALPLPEWTGEQRGKQRLREFLQLETGDLGDRLSLEASRTAYVDGTALVECREAGDVAGARYENTMVIGIDVAGGLVRGLRFYLGSFDVGAAQRVRDRLDRRPAEAAAGETESEILAVERALGDAVLKRDKAAMSAILADDLVAIGHAGNVVDKARYIDIHASPERDFIRFETVDQTVSLVGDIAFVTGTITMVNARLAVNPPPARYSAAYRRNAGRWVICRWHETPISSATF